MGRIVIPGVGSPCSNPGLRMRLAARLLVLHHPRRDHDERAENRDHPENMPAQSSPHCFPLVAVALDGLMRKWIRLWLDGDNAVVG